MEQKVIQIGSSAGVTISKSALEELGIKVGDIVETVIDSSKKVFSVKLKTPKTAVDPEILSWTNEFIDKNRELLLRLKDK